MLKTLTTTCLGLILLSALALGSCKYFKKDSREGETLLARVEDKQLYLSDVADLLKPAKTAEDSAAVIDKYVNDWVRRQLILKKAEIYLPAEEDLDIQKRIEDYRESLLIYAYENELIKQKLDTLVSDAEILEYYDSNQVNFELSDDIIQMYYLKIPRDAPKLDSARALFRLDKEEDKQKLVEYGFQYAKDFYLQDSIWYSINDVYSQIPIDLGQLKTMARNKLAGEVEDSSFIYLLKINDFREQREFAPLDYVKEDIRKIILNRRKNELITSTYDNLYKDAVKSGSFEKYTTQ